MIQNATTVSFRPGQFGDGSSLPTANQRKIMAIMEDYLERLERGSAPCVSQILAENPDVAEPLKAYFDSVRFLADAASIYRAPSVQGDAMEGHDVRRVADYKIIREIGRGGMGVVYEARQMSLDRRVALKVLPFAAVLDQRQIARFRNEAQAAAQLHHGSIVPVYSVGCDRGIHFYAMQFIDGQSLDIAIEELRRQNVSSTTGQLRHGEHSGERQKPGVDASASGPAASARITTRGVRKLTTVGPYQSAGYMRIVAELGIQVAEALQHAHDYGVIHRDIKPSNLLLDQSGKVWVTDFGLARIQSANAITTSRDTLGTVRYMSPEQAAGRFGWVDHRTDVYSLGITLYELLTLRDAFEGADHQEFLRRVEHEEPPRPGRINSAVPLDLETIVLKAIAKSPQQRYGSAQDLAEDLRSFLDGRPIQARRPTVVDRVGKWAMRHRRTVITASSVVAGCLIALSIAMAIIVGQQRRTQTARESAEHHFRAARGAVDQFGMVLVDDLARLPGSEPLRKRVLLDVLRYHQDFVKHAAADPTLRSDLASSLFRIGKISEQAGGTDEAIETYQRALSVYTSLADEFPDTGRYRADAALCHNNLGLLYLRRGDTERARISLDHARKLQGRLIQRWPDDPTFRFELSLTLGNHALLAIGTGKQAEAEAMFEKSIDHHRELTRRFPANDEYRSNLGVSLLNLSSAKTDSDPPASVRLCEEAIEVVEDLVESNPGNLDFRRDLALCHNRIGRLLAAGDEWERSEEAFRVAVDIGRYVTVRAPANADYRCELAATMNNYGQLLLQANRAVEAVDRFVEARALMADLQLLDANDVRYASGMGGVLNNLGFAKQQMGDLTGAIDEFQQAVEIQRAALAKARDVAPFREFLDNHLLNWAEALRMASRGDEAAEALLERLRLWHDDPERLVQATLDLHRALDEEVTRDTNPGTRLTDADVGRVRGEADRLLRRAVDDGIVNRRHVAELSKLHFIGRHAEFDGAMGRSNHGTE